MDAKLASRRLDASIYLLHDGERPSRPSGMAFGGLQCWAIPRRLSDMTSLNARLTYIGGPTALLEWEGLRLLTDPTFDPAGTGYTLPTYTLRKLIDPAVSSDAVGLLDAVLLSHDHHFDNLDHSGRELLNRVGRVFTTPAGATRLGGGVVGLLPWHSVDLTSPAGP